MSRILVAIAVLTVVATAYGDWMIASHELWSAGTLPGSGLPYVSYRILVDVLAEPGDEWTAAGLDLELNGGTFYQDPLGAHPPNPALFPVFPDLELDSYYTSPGDYPNTAFDGHLVGIASTDDTDTVLDTDWFDTIDSGNGEFVIAQITVLPTDPDWIGTGRLDYAGRHSGGTLSSYAFTIPEPATLFLLGLGVLAVVRRLGR